MSGPVLWLLRHGKAAETLGAADAGRPLTARGEAQAREAGERLAQLGVRLDAVLTSPRVRARDTATIAVAAHGSAPAPHVFGELGGDYGADDLFALTSPWFPGGAGEPGPPQLESVPAVLVVGHNPTLTVIVHQLTGDEQGLKPGTLVAIDLERRAVTHHLPPSE